MPAFGRPAACAGPPGGLWESELHVVAALALPGRLSGTAESGRDVVRELEGGHRWGGRTSVKASAFDRPADSPQPLESRISLAPSIARQVKGRPQA
jgi:hypothetical protein